MKKMHCDVIKDLIPSYVEGMCSEATKECVEGHAGECASCRRQIEIYRDTELSDRKMEQKQIDGFKQFHSQLKSMKLFSIGLVLLLISLGVYAFCTNYIRLSKSIYFVLLPVCMIGLYLFTGKRESMKRAEKRDYVVLILSIVDIINAVGFMYYTTSAAINGKTVFAIENTQLGPFIHKVWGSLFLLLILGFVYILLRMLRSNVYNKGILCLQMTGIYLLLAYEALLRELTSVEGFYRIFTQTSMIIGILGFTGCLLFTVKFTGVRKKFK